MYSGNTLTRLVDQHVNVSDELGINTKGFRSCHNIFSVGAEAGNAHRAIMLDGGFFLPLPVIKPADFGGLIIRSCHKVFSVGAETSVDHAVRMLDGEYRFTTKSFCSTQYLGNRPA